MLHLSFMNYVDYLVHILNILNVHKKNILEFFFIPPEYEMFSFEAANHFILQEKWNRMHLFCHKGAII